MEDTTTAANNSSSNSSVLSSVSESERRQQLLDMLIEQQRDKERKRVANLKQAAEERTKNPIWERQKKWDEQRQRNLSKLLAETVEREQGGCSFAPKINPRSRDIASQQRRAAELASPRTHTMPPSSQLPSSSSSPRGTSPSSSRPRSRRNSNGSGGGPERPSSPSAGSLLVGVTGYSNRFIATQTVQATVSTTAVKTTINVHRRSPTSSSNAPREYNPEDGFDKYATDGSSFPSIPNSRTNSPQRQSPSPSRSHSPSSSSSSYQPRSISSSPAQNGRISPSLNTMGPPTIDTGSLLAPPPPPPSYPPPPQAQILSTGGTGISSFNTYKPRPLDNPGVSTTINNNNNVSNDDTHADALVEELVRNTNAPPPPPSGPVPAEATRLPNLPLPTVHESTEVNSTIAQTPIESERGGAGTPEIPVREPLAALPEDIQEVFDETTDSKAIAAAVALRRAEARRIAALGGTVTPSTTTSVSHTPASRMSFTEGSGPISNSTTVANEEIQRLQQLLQEQQTLHNQALAQAIEEATKAAKESAEIAFASEREEYRQRTVAEMDILQLEHDQELTRLRVRYDADIADMARKPSKAQLDHYRTLSEEHLQLQAEKARLFVSEATARRELETLRSNIDTERQQALGKENTLKVELNAAKEEMESLRGRIKGLENDIVVIKARAHETLSQETNKYEKEIDNLSRAHSAEVQALRTSMRVAAAQAAKDAGFKELHSPSKGLVVRVQDLTSTDNSNNSKGTGSRNGSTTDSNNDLSYADILEALASEVATLRVALSDTSKEARKASTEARKNDSKLTELQNEANQLRSERTAWMQQVQKENEQVQNLVKEVRTEKNRLVSELTAIAEERASLESLKRAYDARESILVNILHDHSIPLPSSLPSVTHAKNTTTKNRTVVMEPVNQLRELANKVDSVVIPPAPVNRPPGIPPNQSLGNSNTSAFANPRSKR